MTGPVLGLKAELLEHRHQGTAQHTAQCTSSHQAAIMCNGGCAGINRGLGSCREVNSVPALIADSPGHGPDLHILYPKVVCEGSTLWGGCLTGSAGLTALQGTGRVKGLILPRAWDRAKAAELKESPAGDVQARLWVRNRESIPAVLAGGCKQRVRGHCSGQVPGLQLRQCTAVQQRGQVTPPIPARDGGVAENTTIRTKLSLPGVFYQPQQVISPPHSPETLIPGLLPSTRPRD